jgi:hypothetical protein
MNYSDDNHCFDIGTQMEAFGVLENSTVVLVTQTQKLCWSTSEINDCNNPPSMIIQIWDYRGSEAPRFIAGSSHISSNRIHSKDKTLIIFPESRPILTCFLHQITTL